ncbi:MAG: hypothetical protein KAS32_24600 [Candidatus Peribacteraceae bacterium]|nr:hypothetical protein [Candidatus Peribacteraceae bacterium]
MKQETKIHNLTPDKGTTFKPYQLQDRLQFIVEYRRKTITINCSLADIVEMIERDIPKNLKS